MKQNLDLVLKVNKGIPSPSALLTSDHGYAAIIKSISDDVLITFQ